MVFVPTAVITLWISGLFSFGIIGGAAAFLWNWYERASENGGIDFGESPGLLAAGLALLVWAVAGKLLIGLIGRLVSRHPSRKAGPGGAELDLKPQMSREGMHRRVTRTDGSELQVEFYGPENGIPVILTHGWGLNSTVWFYLKKQLPDALRLIVWDLPGLGRSTKPKNRDYSLENLAEALNDVIGLAGKTPVILAGHSIGGMITLTYCRRYMATLASRVAGIALIHTTPEKPTRTTRFAALSRALEKPLVVPLQYLSIWLSPLMRLMNFTSYLNGTLHLGTLLTSFGGTQTWEQVEFISRYQIMASPAVTARGMLGMLKYDATATLPVIPVPALVVPGDRDPVCRPEASDRMASDIPNAKKIPLEPARHMGFFEHNERFAEYLGDFVRSCRKTVR